MELPPGSVVLSPDEVSELRKSLSRFRHNTNNHLALLVATLELLRLRPERAVELADKMSERPEAVSREMEAFSEAFDRLFGPSAELEEMS